MKTINPYLLLLLLPAFYLLQCGKKSNGEPEPPPSDTFTNPLRNGADPWAIRKDGFYYYSQTMGNRIVLWKTPAMTGLLTAQMVTAYTPPAGAPNSANVWAPEIHFIAGKWYIYYTAGGGPDASQRTWVLENTSADPMTGSWVDKGRIFANNADFWAIDGSVMEYNGSLYFLWSGRPDQSVQNQNLYIARMSNPWTLDTDASLISRPELNWEVHGGPVNEGPQHLVNGSKHFIVYSASGCWTDDYGLGQLSLNDGGDPLQPAHWTKKAQPVFTKNAQGNAYGPGHNSFFKSPDGTEDWILYHANSNSNDGCADRRTVRMQKFSWNSDGSPNFGSPLATGTQVSPPSGE